jgi:hypothetical protein
MLRPSHSFRFCHPNIIGWAVQIIKQYRSLNSIVCIICLFIMYGTLERWNANERSAEEHSSLITRRAFYVKYSSLGIRIHIRVSCSITAKKNIQLTTSCIRSYRVSSFFMQIHYIIPSSHLNRMFNSNLPFT